jgi:hypothetical protein
MSKALGNEIRVTFIEKANVKLHRNYERITGRLSHENLRDLTGRCIHHPYFKCKINYFKIMKLHIKFLIILIIIIIFNNKNK